MDAFIDGIFNSLTNIFPDARIAVVIIAMLPVVEARLAVPIALKCGLSGFESFFFSFLGSSLTAPLILLLLIPVINALSKTRLFKKAGDFLLGRFQKKAGKMENSGSKAGFKQYLGVFGFVALPLPLTGVWTGSAVAAVLKLRFWGALAAVILGNLCASLIITLLSVFFSEHINIIILIITALAALTVVYLLLRMFLHKPGKPRPSA